MSTMPFDSYELPDSVSTKYLNFRLYKLLDIGNDHHIKTRAEVV